MTDRPSQNQPHDPGEPVIQWLLESDPAIRWQVMRDFGLDPESAEAGRAVGLVRDRVTWKGCGPQECDENSFFDGELEPCINGQVGAAGAYFGQRV